MIQMLIDPPGRFDSNIKHWFDLQLDALNTCLFTYNTCFLMFVPCISNIKFLLLKPN